MSDRGRFSSISIINHWVSAMLVIVMLTLGFMMDQAPADPVEDYVKGVHIALGFFLLFIVVWRVAVRLYEGFPESTGASAFERHAASVVQKSILFFLVILVITGPLYLFTENECMDVFGWFSFCIPLESLSAIHEPAEWIHKKSGTWILPILLVLHFFGAIRHYLQAEKPATLSDL